MHGLVCQTNSTYFFRINRAEEEGLAESQYEWSTPQEHSSCDLSVPRGTSSISSSWYLEEENTTDLEEYRKGY